MRIVNHIVGKLADIHSIVTSSKEANEIIVSLTSSDYLNNVVHLYMTPSDTRIFAHQLIAAAEKLDPQT